MTSELVEDEDQFNLLVKRNEEVIANYPITELKLLKEKFKDICLTSEFRDYASLDDFINSIDFLEFLEYFLNDLNKKYPDLTTYKKYKNQITDLESSVHNYPMFKNLMHNCLNYLFGKDLNFLLNKVNSDYKSLLMLETFGIKQNEKVKQLLIRLYNGFLYFLELLIERPNDIYPEMTLFTMFKRKLLEGKLIKSQPTFNQSSLTIIHNQFEYKEILEYRKNLLSKFRLFQRKYLSDIAKLRKIGPPKITNKELLDIKKELNKNKNVDYKAYEIFCKYVLSKEYNEDIYDYLAGIHKNSNGRVIHKNINNNTVANIKANTKEKHHKEYLEKSEAILEIVEAKIEKHGDIIDIKTKHQVERIRKLFDSKQFKNLSLSSGNENSPSIGGKIIQDCKRIRAINKEIDKMIKEHMKKEQKQRNQDKEKQRKQKQEQRKNNKNEELTGNELQLLSNLSDKHQNIKTITDIKKKVRQLILKYHPNKFTKHNEKEKEGSKKITQNLVAIKNKLNKKKISEGEL